MDSSTKEFAGFLLILFIFVRIYRYQKNKKDVELKNNDRLESSRELEYLKQDIKQINTASNGGKNEPIKSALSSGSKDKEKPKKSVSIQEAPLKKKKVFKRKVTQDMIEVVQTLAPSLSVAQIRYSLKQTGSVETTVEDFLSGKEMFDPTKDKKVEKKDLQEKNIEKDKNTTKTAEKKNSFYFFSNCMLLFFAFFIFHIHMHHKYVNKYPICHLIIHIT
ncbi:hypothetical protein TBLA_0B03070 [Henningerozyma blattae CBS 6284]|uniref:CUE domain-containing protein n=1 Tax=Henningerozyma blattae (strain ATCC 34711 / CBS 6284 / DSM 70876 / NBRC 10599 / NRRL Y-10934 / UCD 77-7) TaxID=1071380 RepID=I2GYE7_HENB6|nr:hypothetical protein TBLA_0B03070 [Tetrapisispora blattae CBS 6284]CCH59149.1 hypothetical protein TBLA_0B03070 [Tetrapisispora blattae CBS 6284]